MIIDRRQFLRTGTAAGTLALSPRLWAAESPAVMLDVHPDRPICRVPNDFMGLSYESSQLAHPAFFSADNKQLISYLRTLGKEGVLRIGGNKSEFTKWSPVDIKMRDDFAGEDPDGDSASHGPFVITPQAIRNLNDFLAATNWKLIYGLNILGSSSDQTAEEAAFVHQTIGSRLLAFQIGNEPDLFNHGTTKNVDQRWSYPEFAVRWRVYERAIRARVPNALLAGPDVSYRAEWLKNFSADAKGSVSLLTSHYYAEGPPTDPAMNINYLLTQQAKFESHIGNSLQAAKGAGLPYRVSECNSCYHGGKRGLSDTYASALWAGDFLCQVASLGATGVNLHGGGNGAYTPIAGDARSGFTARPIYYGLLMARSLAGSTLVETDLHTNGTNLTAYAMQRGEALTILAFNKDRQPATLRIAVGGKSMAADVMCLDAPAIDATSRIKFGGNTVAKNGSWQPAPSKRVHPVEQGLFLTLPPYQAISIELM